MLRSVSVWKKGAHGPEIAPDHPRLDDETAARVAAYLRSGTVVLRTTARQPDLLDPGLGAVVPVSTLTDGEWIWNQAVTYYVGKYRLSPGEDFLGYCRQRNYVPRTASEDEIRVVLDELGQ